MEIKDLWIRKAIVEVRVGRWKGRRERYKGRERRAKGEGGEAKGGSVEGVRLTTSALWGTARLLFSWYWLCRRVRE